VSAPETSRCEIIRRHRLDAGRLRFAPSSLFLKPTEITPVAAEPTENGVPPASSLAEVSARNDAR